MRKCNWMPISVTAVWIMPCAQSTFYNELKSMPWIYTGSAPNNTTIIMMMMMMLIKTSDESFVVQLYSLFDAATDVIQWIVVVWCKCGVRPTTTHIYRYTHANDSHSLLTSLEPSGKTFYSSDILFIDATMRSYETFECNRHNKFHIRLDSIDKTLNTFYFSHLH